ncbi:MAG: isoprenylcysteine carboxylmethyltransferase family protein [Anaerolineales bacterium]
MDDSKDSRKKALIRPKGISFLFIFMFGVGSAFFIPYGGIDWWEAWLLLSLWLAYFLLMLTVVKKINPDVVEERANSLDRFSQSWDQIIVSIYQVVSLSLYIIAGLDVGRFGWTAEVLGGVPAWLKWIAFVFVLFVYLFPCWAIISNPFASGAVRIQEEREHQAVASGPYRIVRHPMYLGTVVYGFAFPLFLESDWALIPGVIVIGLFILRTALEDKFLMANLPGYPDYAQQTRYRLLPGVW